MGEVWLASAEGPHGFRKKVVLKIVRQDLAERRDLVDMLIREAAIAARLNHPNIVTVFDLDQVDGTYFFAMEHVPGHTMADVVRRVQKRGGALAPWFLLGVIASCCDGLQYAHDLADEHGRPLGLVHRDISLGNLMVSTTGNVTILDFGIAVSSAAELETESGMLKGKFQYMPPETIRGELIDRRCDIYGLGVVMYIAITGRVPYPDLAEYDLLRTIVSRPPPPISAVQRGVPRTIERIVETAMAHDRDDRYPDATALAAAVRDQLRGRGVPTADELARYVNELFAGDGPVGDTGASLQLLTIPSGPPPPPPPSSAPGSSAPPSAIAAALAADFAPELGPELAAALAADLAADPIARSNNMDDHAEVEEVSIDVDDLIGEDPSDDLAIPEASDLSAPHPASPAALPTSRRISAASPRLARVDAVDGRASDHGAHDDIEAALAGVVEPDDAVPFIRTDDAPSAKTTPMRASLPEPAVPAEPGAVHGVEGSSAGASRAGATELPSRLKTAGEPVVGKWGPVGLLPPIGAGASDATDVFTTTRRRPATRADDSIFDGWTRSVHRPDTEDPDKPPRWPWSR
jgi:serine/threonine protein kinase